MSITSFSYFIFIAIAVVVYYLLPPKCQWIELLIFSITFYFMAGVPYTFVYVGITTAATWIVTNLLRIYRIENGQRATSRKYDILIFASIFLDISLWFVLKGKPFIDGFMRVFHFSKEQYDSTHFIAALGMGYYTLQLIGYTLDCYWDTIEVQRNPLKLLLFASFFPQMTTGPISHYTELKGLFQKHNYEYVNIAHGAQRIVWGLLKKLVIAERTGIIVNAVWSDLSTYNGIYTWIAFLVYPIQMYTDFSGCMDIVIGTAELFDIKLIENFNNPFFSRTSQEFWQRWHISLGKWAKDYVLYPLLKSKWMIKLGKKLRSKYGKQNGKFLATSIGMLALWFVMGFWHGDYKYIIGVSLWYWIILMLGDYFSPYGKKITDKFAIDTDSFGWRIFQSMRTYLIYAVGAVFFRGSNILTGITFLKGLIIIDTWNPWILTDGSILNLGLSYKDINVVIIGIMFMVAVAILRERHVYARYWLDKQPTVFRWIAYAGVILFVIIFGMYGPNYEASNFIYGDF